MGRQSDKSMVGLPIRRSSPPGHAEFLSCAVCVRRVARPDGSIHGCSSCDVQPQPGCAILAAIKAETQHHHSAFFRGEIGFVNNFQAEAVRSAISARSIGGISSLGSTSTNSEGSDFDFNTLEADGHAAQLAPADLPLHEEESPWFRPIGGVWAIGHWFASAEPWLLSTL